MNSNCLQLSTVQRGTELCTVLGGGGCISGGSTTARGLRNNMLPTTTIPMPTVADTANTPVCTGHACSADFNTVALGRVVRVIL